MKILLVNKLYYPHIGGVENHVRELAREIKNYVDVHILVANEEPKTITETIDGIEVTKVASLGRFRSAPLAPAFPLWLRRLKSDIYHFHFPNPTGELSYLLANPPGKLVVTYHSDIIRQKLLVRLYAPFLKKFLSRADCIIASSPNMIEHSSFLQNFKDKCVVIPFGIDLKQFELNRQVEARAAELREKYGPKVILFLGRLIYYKGLEYLLLAMKNIQGRLLIVGSGPLETKLKKLGASLGIGSKVTFLGDAPEEELSAYYYACDVFVLPSTARSEAFGIAQLEAQVCGKPVVSTKLTTGVPFVNLNGVTGIVVPPRSASALAEAINKLLDDENLRRKYGEQAKKRVEQEFSRELMGKRVVEVYERCLNQPGRLFL